MTKETGSPRQNVLKKGLKRSQNGHVAPGISHNILPPPNAEKLQMPNFVLLFGAQEKNKWMMKMGNQRGRSLKHTGLMRASITLGQGEGFESDTAESIIQVRLHCAALQERLWSDAVEEKNG